MYPTYIKRIFNEGLLYYNDYDNGILRIKHEPFRAVKIPKDIQGKKKSISVENLNLIFNFDKPHNNIITVPLAIDVSKLIFYLAGINAADLYYMEKSCFKDGKLCYNRKKTSHRDDGAYMEITVPDEIIPLLDKYKGKEKLFSFSEMYYHPDNFSKYINKGLKEICEVTGIDKATTYTFRHSWATIAQNDCGASTELVGFCLNHSSAHKVTEGYIKKDYSKVDLLNDKVIKTLRVSQQGGEKVE